MFKTPREQATSHNTGKHHIGRAGSGDPLGFLETESLLSEGAIPTVMPNRFLTPQGDENLGQAVQSEDFGPKLWSAWIPSPVPTIWKFVSERGPYVRKDMSKHESPDVVQRTETFCGT